MGKGKWTVFRNRLDGRTYYITGRLADDSRPPEFLNIEFRGRYTDDLAACREEAERLPEIGEIAAVTYVTRNGVRNWNRAFVDSNGSWHGSGNMYGVVAWMPVDIYRG